MNIKIVLLLIAMLVGQGVLADDLNKIREKGVIEFAVYENFPPYSFRDENGRESGIDVDIARAVAEKLGVKADFKLFTADESVEDDLRNVVWKGHFTAGPPADVMMHAPYDINFANDNDKVMFTEPYFREVIAFAIDTRRLLGAHNLHVFMEERIGVETATLSDAYLIKAYGGQLRDNVMHYNSVKAAVDSMLKSEIPAVMANRGELEYALSGQEHDFVVTKLSTPGLPVEGWELCIAVNATDTALAHRINDIVKELKANGAIENIFKSYGLSFHLAKSSKPLFN